jgi:hypothetical protein
MPHEPDNAVPSSTGREGSFRNLLLLVSCIVGLLAGLGVFGFVCYLLMR